MFNYVYSVAEKLPLVNVEVIGYDEDFNSFNCTYGGEYWFIKIGDIPIICDTPKFWKYKNTDE